MPTKPSKAPTTQAPQDEQGFVSAQTPPSRVGPGQQLAGTKPYFVLMVSPARWTCLGGHFVPDLAKVEARVGVGMNTPNDARYPGGAITTMRRQHFQELPDDLEFTCFGAQESYRDWYETTHPQGIWSEKWVRPRVLGGSIRWVTNAPGQLSFLLAAKKWLLAGQELSEDQIELALEQPFVTARSYLGRASTDATIRARLDVVIALIPSAHLPPDLREFAPKPAE